MARLPVATVAAGSVPRPQAFSEPLLKLFKRSGLLHRDMGPKPVSVAFDFRKTKTPHLSRTAIEQIRAAWRVDDVKRSGHGGGGGKAIGRDLNPGLGLGKQHRREGRPDRDAEHHEQKG